MRHLRLGQISLREETVDLSGNNLVEQKLDWTRTYLKNKIPQDFYSLARPSALRIDVFGLTEYSETPYANNNGCLITWIILFDYSGVCLQSFQD